MKKISKVEKAILEMNNFENYDTYRCSEHGIYQIRKDLTIEKHLCIYCKKANDKLSESEIKTLLLQ